jgi:uncharacterized protein involved in exopolysaccharide biosynthesis
LPVDPRRLVRALRSARRWIGVVVCVATVLGAVLGKFVIGKTYVATATILWQPPAAARADAARELATLSQSVKLPANLQRVRDLVSRGDSVDVVGKRVDVQLGDQSMLIGVKAQEKSAELAAKLANATVDVFIDSQKDLAADRLKDVAAALRQSLAQSETALGDARTSYDDFRRTNRVADFSQDVQASIAELARLHLSLNDARAELDGLGARERELQRARQEIPSDIVLSRSEQNVDAVHVAQLESELAEKRAHYSEDNPLVLTLAAEVKALHQRPDQAATITGQIVGRNAMRDTFATQAEESAAAKSALEKRSRTLEDLEGEARRRTEQLTAVQGEAARLLANVEANEQHVAGLLKQIAMAEDDVRGASSNFQVVSHAAPPEHSEKGIGRIVAAGVPVLAAIVTVLVVVIREVKSLRVVTGKEAAYWGRAPVLCSTAWPVAGLEDASRAGRACADAFEVVGGAIGVTAVGAPREAAELAVQIVERLRHRGVRAAVLDGPRIVGGAAEDLVDALEHGDFGARIARARRTNRAVFVLLPDTARADAVRAAQRWLDGTLVVVPSGTIRIPDLGGLGASFGLAEGGMSLVVTADGLRSSVGAVADPTRLYQRDRPAQRSPRRKRSGAQGLGP